MSSEEFKCSYPEIGRDTRRYSKRIRLPPKIECLGPDVSDVSPFAVVVRTDSPHCHHSLRGLDRFLVRRAE